MKLRIDADHFTRAVEWASAAVGNRPPAPIMAGLVITADDQGVTVTGTDYDRFHKASTTADVEVGGSVVLSANLLGAISKNLRRDDVLTLALDDHRVTATAPGLRYTLPTLGDPGMFPTTPAAVSGGARFGPELGDFIKRAEPIAARNTDASASTSGLWLVPQDGKLTVLSASRFRAALDDIAPEDGDLFADPIAVAWGMLPRAIVGPATIAVAGGMVQITLADNAAIERTAWLRTLDAPPIHEAIARMTVAAELVAEWDRQELIHAVSAASIGDMAAPMAVAIDGGTTTLSLRGDDADSSAECKSDAAIERTFGVDPAYLREGLAALTTERVQLHSGSARLAAMLWTEVGGTARYVLAPKQLQ